MAPRDLRFGSSKLGDPPARGGGTKVERHAGGVLARGTHPRSPAHDVEQLLRERITQRLGIGSGDPSDVAQGATLIASGYEETRVDTIFSSFIRFKVYCDEKAPPWETAGCMTMVTYLGHLFSTGTIQGETAEQYVSAVNRAYDLLGLDAPGRPRGSKDLYFEVQKALKGFTKRRLLEDGIASSKTVPTPGKFMIELGWVALMALEKSNLKLARASISNIFQFFMIWRPTMAAAALWDSLNFIDGDDIEVTMARLMPGRKNKTGREKKVVRRPTLGSRYSGMHPVLLIARYQVLLLEECTKLGIECPKQMWLLPKEKTRVLGSADMRKWLLYAAKETFSGLPDGITPRSHRSGSSTMAYRLLKDYPVFCNIADWELTGNTFQKTYFCPNLAIDLEIAALFFADLAQA